MTPPEAPAASGDQEFGRLTDADKINYLRLRQQFLAAGVRFILGEPPTGVEVGWDALNEIKAIVAWARAEHARQEQQKIRRARIRSYAIRVTASAAGGTIVWVAAHLAAPFGVWLTTLLTFPARPGR